MIKRVVLISLLCVMSLEAKYTVFYRGFSIGEIEDVSSIHQEYLRIKITSSVYRLITMQPYVCYYFGQKPAFAETKFHMDYQRYLAVFKMLLEERPKEQDLLVCGENDVMLRCPTRDACSYTYYEAGKLLSNGAVLFDENDQISAIQDSGNNLRIIRDSIVQ